MKGDQHIMPNDGFHTAKCNCSCVPEIDRETYNPVALVYHRKYADKPARLPEGEDPQVKDGWLTISEE